MVLWCDLKPATVCVCGGGGVLEPLGSCFGAGQGQPLLVPGMEPVGRSYQVICGWLPLVLFLEVPGRGSSANQSWLSLELGLGPFGRHYNLS